MTASEKSSGTSLFVEQDISLERDRASGRVIATAVCVRQGRTVRVQDCAGCAHFARIDTHEAGYQLVCRNEPKPSDEAIEPILDADGPTVESGGV